jgi:hypothetical protein
MGVIEVFAVTNSVLAEPQIPVTLLPTLKNIEVEDNATKATSNVYSILTLFVFQETAEKSSHSKTVYAKAEKKTD